MAAGSRTRNRTTKAEQAEATRRRITDAATELFLRDGFVSTTMASVAREAGVAVQTLYLSFGSKTAILQGAFDQALRGTDPVDIGDSDWFRGALTQADGPAALELFCAGSAEVIHRAAPLFEVMRAASADPEVGEMLARNKLLRADGFRTVVEVLATREGFAAGLSVDDAHAILYAVLSEDGYLLLVTERGWSPEQWRSWVTGTCRAQFFPGR